MLEYYVYSYEFVVVLNPSIKCRYSHSYWCYINIVSKLAIYKQLYVCKSVCIIAVGLAILFCFIAYLCSMTACVIKIKTEDVDVPKILCEEHYVCNCKVYVCMNKIFFNSIVS